MATNYLIFIGGAIGSFIIYGIIRGIITKRNAEDLTYSEATKEHFKDMTKPEHRIDKHAGKIAPAKTLGGQPMYYNEVDHTIGRFVSMYRTESDMADARVIHNNCYRIRYLKDVTYFWFIKASKEEITPCVFRPGIDVISKAPGEAAGVPAEGIVIIKRSMDGQLLATGDGERYRSLLLMEKSWNAMLADKILFMSDHQRRAHMDPTSKEYTDDMVAMVKRNKTIVDAAGGQRQDNFGLGNPYAQEMYGNEDSIPQPGGDGGQDNGLWRLG